MDPTENLLAKARLQRMIKAGEPRAIRQSAGVSLRDVARAIRRDLEASTLLTWEEGLHWPRRVNDMLAWLRILDELRAVMGPEEGDPETVTAGTRGP